MSRRFIFIWLAIVLVICGIIALFAVLHLKKAPDLTELDNILEFMNARLDECVVGKLVFSEQNRGSLKTASLTGVDASTFANQFGSIIRQHCVRIMPERYNIIYTYDITFKGQDLVWMFQFGFPNGETLINYTREPSTSGGTVLIGKEAQPKLEALLENALSKNPETSGLP